MARQRPRFGEQLRHYREAAGFSQEELAERAGLSANAISALERGERKRPHPDTLRRLAEALGLSEQVRAELAAAVRPPSEATPSSALDSHALPPATAELPGEPTPLIGREREVAVVCHLLAQASGRLLTLTGPGGVGKTRLALHVARRVSNHYPDGVVWVELAPLGDPALVLPTIARSLGLQAALGGDTSGALRSWLQDKQLLLMLDNFEHVLDAGSDVAKLRLACPGLRLLVTSRTPLNIRGEQEYAVPPLELPLAGPALREGDVVTVPSVQLFVWQARQKQPSFELNPQNTATVAAICRRMDGIPLALELAAARVKLLGTAELLARLDRALRVLTGGPRDLPARQQTMEGAVRWSYDLLKPAEQTLFRRLSVFAGGWTLEAAEVIGADRNVDVLDMLGRLVGQSLVVAEMGEDGTTRYRMLEPVRQYAGQLLAELGETETVSARHAAHYLQLAERVGPALNGPHQGTWLDRLEVEHDNLRVAIAWGLGNGCSDLVVRLTYTLRRFFWPRGLPGEVRRWMEEALATELATPSIQARAVYVLHLMRYRVGEAVSVAAIEDAAKAMRAEGDRMGAADAFLLAGLASMRPGDTEHGVRLLQESRRLYEAIGDEQGAAQAIVFLGGVPMRAGDYEAAAELFERGLELARRSGNPLSIFAAVYNMALAAQGKGEDDRARDSYTEALTLGQQTRDRPSIAFAMVGLAECAVALGDIARAARLYGAADAIFASVGMAFHPFQATAAFHDRYLELARGQLGPEAFEAGRAEGQTMPMEEATTEALTTPY